MVRKVLFWGGWSLVLFYALYWAYEVYVIQDLPKIQPFKWMILGVTVALIYATRDREEVTAHHLPH
jgi:hypothetical protein